MVANRNHKPLRWFQFTTSLFLGGHVGADADAGVASGLRVLLAAACGVSVANVYYAQPLLDRIGADLSVRADRLGLVTAVTQLGYLLGLVLIVPLAVALGRLLPRDNSPRARVSYPALIFSVLTLTARDRTFRVRSVLGLLMFGSFGAVWGSIALPLSAAPWHLSAGKIGLFGIAGAAGALSAGRAGRLADRGHAQLVRASRWYCSPCPGRGRRRPRIPWCCSRSAWPCSISPGRRST